MAAELMVVVVGGEVGVDRERGSAGTMPALYLCQERMYCMSVARTAKTLSRPCGSQGAVKKSAIG